MAGNADVIARRWVAKVRERFVRIHRGAIIELGRRTVQRTPVDTGHARAGYHITINAAGFYRANETDRSGTQTVQRIRSAVQGIDLGRTVYLTNNVPYIIRLEYGYSQQSPQGMVRLTAREWQSIVDHEARKALI